jgi:hypothetical protein
LTKPCKRAYAALKAAGGDDFNRQSVDESVIDLLTDIRYLCKTEDLDFEHLANMSHSHFCQEGGE